MIKNYFKTAWRTLVRNKTYSFINIVGLTTGLFACMLVATVVIDDLSYDRQWSKSNDLYRIISVNKMGDGLYDRSEYSLIGLANKLKSDYPEVEAVANITSLEQQFKLNDNNPNGVTANVLQADTSTWNMLDLHVISGNPRKYIEGKRNTVISESFRRAYFQNENPVGKIIYDVPAYTDKAEPYIITGIIKDLPSNTVFRSDVIILKKGFTEDLNKQQYGGFSPIYVLMKPGTNMAGFSKKINKWYADYVEVKNPYQFEFQPAEDIYLHSDFSKSQSIKGSYKNIFILGGVAILLLVIACINFINLTTARALQRLKETGVRKVLGAGRGQLVGQFLTESLLLFLISYILAMLVYQLALTNVENYIGHPLAKTFLHNLSLFLSFCFLILAISFLTGIYPAWVVSGFKPALTLKGKYTGKLSGQHFVKKSLVVFQFAMSIVVLIALIVVRQQVSFLNNKNIGYNKNNLLIINPVSWDGKGEAFKNELLNLPGIVNASITGWTPTQGAGTMSREIDDPGHAGNKIRIWYINADPDIAKTLGLHLQSGRFLDKSFSADTQSQDSLMSMSPAEYEAAAMQQSSIVTAYTAKVLHINTLNRPLKDAKTLPVGIVEDFNNSSLKDDLEPTIIVAESSLSYGGMLIRTEPGAESKVATSLNKLWRQFYPDKLFDINTVSETLEKQYVAESKLLQLFSFFSGLSMFLAALGIFGLIIQSTEQRIKEIGIRKVLGASIYSIVRLFSLDFFRLVIVAIIIASPISWWLMNKWLLDYSYTINISWRMFAAAGFIAMLIALITISLQTVKAAVANPVKSLRTE